MRGFKPYPAYKDSRVEWLGEVPEHWNVCRMAHLEQGGDDFVSGPFGSSLGSADYVDEGIPVIRGVNTTLRAERKFVEEDFVFVTEEKYADLCRCNAVPGDLIFTARGTVGKVALVPGSVPISLISPNQLRFRPRNEKVIAEYFFYMFSSENLLVEVILSSDSVAQPNMNLGSLKAIKVMLPPSCEQTQIARFLDHETARIDALIDEQQRLIELLKEKRQAVISHAVTKGLDPTVPMKDSGVEWLGEVPAHWEVGSLRRLIKSVGNGTTADQVDEAEDTVAVSRIETISAGLINFEKVGHVGPQDVAKRFLLNVGDILFSHINSLSMIGNVAIYSGGRPLLHGMNLLRIQPLPSISSEWLLYWLKSKNVRQEVESRAKPAINQASISTDSVRALPALIPPSFEQTQIARFLDYETARIDALIEEANSGVGLLQERRSALISAVVTGKIDVRGWQPPANIQAPESAVAEAV